MARVFIIHGWGGTPVSDWIPWAKDVLKAKGYNVLTPEMPDTDHPKIEAWVSKLSDVVGSPSSDDIFIGHSIGCQTILRYLEKLPEGNSIAKVILVAPWWFLKLTENEEQEDADPWLAQDVDLAKVKSRADSFIAIFSDNDPWVPLEKNIEFFKKNLDPEIVVKNKMGHFLSNEGVEKAPFLLDFL